MKKIPAIDQVKSIAVFRLSALGDIVMMVPMVRTLQQYFPSAKITWIISKAFYPLLDGMDGIEFVVIDKPQTRTDYKKLKQLFKPMHFDVLLAAQANFRVNRIYPKINADIKIGFDAKRARDLHKFFIDTAIPAKQNHLLEGFMQFAEVLGAEPIIRWDLPIADADRDFAARHMPEGRWLAINPMASKPDRNWPIERFVSLIQMLQKNKNLNIVFTGGPGEAEVAYVDAIVAELDLPVTNLVGKTSLKQLAAVLARADALLSPDTGPAHLACAMGTKVVSLFVDITPKLSAPYLCEDLVVNYYEQAMQTFHRKAPQQIQWNQRVHHPDAMALIPVSDVLQKLKLALGTLMDC